MSSTSTRRRGGSALALLVFLLVGALLGATALWGISRAGLLSGDATPEVNSTTISNSFEEIAELSVEEYNFTNVGKYSNEGRQVLGFNVPLTGKDFLLTYDGTVKAGVSDITQANVSVDDAAQVITVDMPRVEITSTQIDSNSVVVYDQSMNPLNQVRVEDVTEFVSAERATAEQKAIDAGLLTRAEDRVQQLVESHVDALTDGTEQEDYAVEVNWQ